MGKINGRIKWSTGRKQPETVDTEYQVAEEKLRDFEERHKDLFYRLSDALAKAIYNHDPVELHLFIRYTQNMIKTASELLRGGAGADSSN